MADDSLSDADRSGAMLAHLSGYAGYVVPCGGVLVPILIAATTPSKTVAVVARQALFLNVVGFFSLLPALGAYLLVAAVRSPGLQVVIAGVTTFWVMLVLGLILICPLVGAIKASGGKYYRYPIFGLSMERSRASGNAGPLQP